MSHDPDIDDLMEQIECSTIIKENIEGRLNGWLVKYAAMKDALDTWQMRAEFSYQERNKLEKQRDELLAALEFACAKISDLHLEAGDGDCHYPIINDAISSAKGGA